MVNSSPDERAMELYRQAYTLFIQKRFAEALPYLDQCLELDPHLGVAWGLRGYIDALVGRDPQTIVRDLKMAQALLPEPVDDATRATLRVMRMYKSAALYLLKRYQEAVDGFAEVRATGVLDARFAILEGDGYRQLGQQEQALAACQRAVEAPHRDQATTDQWIWLSQTLLNWGDAKNAILAANEALAQQPQRVDGWLLKARAQLELGQYLQCLKTIDEALSLDPQRAVAWKIKGAAAGFLQQFEVARVAYHQAVLLTRTDPKARAGAVRGEVGALMGLGRPVDALRVATQEAQRRADEQEQSN